MQRRRDRLGITVAVVVMMAAMAIFIKLDSMGGYASLWILGVFIAAAALAAVFQRRQ